MSAGGTGTGKPPADAANHSGHGPGLGLAASMQTFTEKTNHQIIVDPELVGRQQ